MLIDKSSMGFRVGHWHVQTIPKRTKSKNRMQITEFLARLSQHKRVLREIQVILATFSFHKCSRNTGFCSLRNLHNHPPFQFVCLSLVWVMTSLARFAIQLLVKILSNFYEEDFVQLCCARHFEDHSCLHKNLSISIFERKSNDSVSL